MMMGQGLLPSFVKARWSRIKDADGGFFIAWRLITFLLVLLGFGALASTGELPSGVMAVFVVLWLVAFFTFERPEFWRDWMSKALVWAALALIGTVAMQFKFVSVLYLMLFLALYKCFTLREAIDHLHALILSFFMFLACSIITASIVYLGFLFLFIVLMMLDMICLTIAREGARVYAGFGTTLANHTASGLRAGYLIWRRLFLSSLVTGAVILVMTIGLFLSVPHYSVNRIPNPWIRHQDDTSRVSGYTDDISFGALNNLKLDDTLVMTITPAWEDGVERPFPPGLRMRGQALDLYNETRWTSSERSRMARSSTTWNEINFPRLPAAQGPVLSQRIKQNIFTVRRLFGASMPFQFLLSKKRHQIGFMSYQRASRRSEFIEPFRLRLDWTNGSVQVIPVSSWGLANLSDTYYTAFSHITEDPMPLMRAHMRARLAGRTDPTPFLPPNFSIRPLPGLTLAQEQKRINTAMPATNLTRKLTKISKEVAGGASTPEKIVYLMNWFYSHFEYSLTPENRRGIHPLETFLTLSHRGHCEYFASAFVLLLRCQEIPARIATGFFTSEILKTEGGPVYNVRQSDAHAWAEVWIDGYGWLTFDPTPPDWRGRTSRLREQPSMWVRMMDWSKSSWQHYVLDYSAYQQQRLTVMLKDTRYGRLISNTVNATIDTMHNLMLLNQTGDRLSNREVYIRSLLLLLALLLALLLLYTFVVRSRRQAHGAIQRSTVAFMNQLLQRMQALGWKRTASQTPAEWIADIERQTQGRWQLQGVLDLYHRCRFAQEPMTPEEEARVRETIRQLR